MSARIISTNKEAVTIEVTIELSKSLLKSEEAILEALCWKLSHWRSHYTI